MIPFSPPYIPEEAINEIVDTLRSGWITTGPKTKLFEKMLTEYCGNKRTICLNSATAGLELVLRWYGVKEGDEVILPTYTYCATANVVIHCGAKPVMVDTNTEDFNISLKAIRDAITTKTKVIIPVDIGGFPCDYLKIYDLVHEENIKQLFIPKTKEQEKLGRILIMSDSAHSIGGTYHNEPLGKQADITIFSFHAVKNLTTAEGGAIALNLPEQFDNDSLYNHFNITCLHGQDKDALAKTSKRGWNYDVIDAGFKSNLTDIASCMGIIQLQKYNDIIARRREIFGLYTAALSKFDWADIPVYKTEHKESSYHLYMLRIKNIDEETRNRIIEEIFSKEVSVNVHFKPLPLLSYYKNLGYRMEDYPSSYANYSREISLPVFYTLSNEGVQEVIDAVVSSVQKVLALD